MSDRSVEDEMMAEVGRFSVAMRSAITRHAQAANWLERRKARKEISRLVRTERREADHARTQHKDWTSQAVNRYRIHAQTVALRANDPTVDHTRRARDAWALAEHRTDLAKMFVTNGHLTTTERGIALDGLDAATVFPEYKTGNLFNRAHKVKGIEALRYRAQVARTQKQLGIDRVADASQLRRDQPQRVTAESVRETGAETLTRSQEQAIQGLRSAQLEWDAGSPGASEQGRARLTEQWRDAARAAEKAGLTSERIEQEFAQAQKNSQFVATVSSLPHPQASLRDLRQESSYHPSEAEAIAWTERHVRKGKWTRDSALRADVMHRDDRDNSLRTTLGHPQQVAAAVQEWTRNGQETDRPATEWSTAEPAASVRQVLAERDQLREDLASMKQRHHLSIEHNGTLSDQNAQLTRQLSEVTSELDRSQEAWAHFHEREMDAVKLERDDARRERDELLAERESNAAVIQARAERDQMRAERDELLHERESDEIEFTQRDLETTRRELEQVTAERNRLRGERDEAVQKLAERTPASERYGSPERQAEHAKNTAANRSPLANHRPGAALAEAVARNGHDRGDLER